MADLPTTSLVLSTLRKDGIVAIGREYLVEAATPPSEPGHHTKVVVCLDDDNHGRRSSALWELALGARLLQPEPLGLGDVDSSCCEPLGLSPGHREAA